MSFVVSKNTAHRHIAYFFVHSFPRSLYLVRSVLKILAISGTNGSSGFGSVKSDEMDNRTETNRSNMFHHNTHQKIQFSIDYDSKNGTY